MSGYPKRLIHPAFAPAVLGTGYGDGLPARYPPVDVGTEDQEEFYRARGYLPPGEARTAVPYIEYPKMLRHPDHREAVPDQIEGRRREDGVIEQFVIRGTPEAMPDAIVHSAEDEAVWRDRGYRPIGEGDPQAFDRAKAAPLPELYEPMEWPKWVEGRLVGDPHAPPPVGTEYPKWIGEGEAARIVHSAAEEYEFCHPGLSKAAEPAEQEPASPIWQECVAGWLAASDEPPDEREALVAQAAQLGMGVDGRWSNRRIRAEIEALLNEPAEDSEAAA